MNTTARAVLLTAAVYALTMCVSALIISLTIMVLLEPHSCGAVGRALLLLWGMTAALFLASVLVVIVLVWRTVQKKTSRVAIAAVYGTLMLASFILIAFGQMVLFNC